MMAYPTPAETPKEQQRRDREYKRIEKRLSAKAAARNRRAIVPVGTGRLVRTAVLSGLFKWVTHRMRLAERCEIAAAERNDHVGALRFEHEHNALLPVLEKLAAEMGAAKKRQPPSNDPSSDTP